MCKSYLIVSIAVGVILFAGQALAGPVTFTGDVPTDFVGEQFFLDPDGGLDDVGMPPGFTTTGNAIIQLAVAYDTLSDTLYVGIDTVGIALDVDGDGDPGHTSSKLKRLGGHDYPSCGVAESFTFSIDLDNDGFFDVIAGLDLAGTATAGYQVAAFSGDPWAPYLAFGAPIPGVGGSMNHDPSAAMPDLEFTVTGLTNIDPGFDGNDIHLHAFVGSLADDGFGEDFLEVFPIPEPTTLVLVGATVALLAGVVRKRLA